MPIRDFRRHTDGLAQCRMWVDGFAYVHAVCAHFDGKADFTNQIARTCADDVAAEDASCNFFLMLSSIKSTIFRNGVALRLPCVAIRYRSWRPTVGAYGRVTGY